jgi:hypothetical protein
MQGWRSQNLAIVPYNPEIERIIRQKQKDNSKAEEEFEARERMEENSPVRRPMKNAFMPQSLDQPSCIDFQPVRQSNFNLYQSTSTQIDSTL